MNFHNHIAILVIVLSGLLTHINSQPDDYLVSLIYEEDTICAGSLVSMRIVITAAACLTYLDKNLIRVVGSARGFSRRNVEDISYPSNCLEGGNRNRDIAGIKLKEPFENDDGVIIIPLCQNDLPVGTKMKIRQWTGRSTNPTHCELVKQSVTLVAPHECVDYHEEKYMYCAKDDAEYCIGAAGEPGVVGGKLCAVGIYSGINNPKLYINISEPQILGFINDLIEC